MTAGVEMDVLGIDYDHFSDEQREAVQQHPRPAQFKEEIIQHFMMAFNTNRRRLSAT